MVKVLFCSRCSYEAILTYLEGTKEFKFERTPSSDCDRVRYGWESEFEFQIQSHPDYLTLLSISDTLSFFKINNDAIKINSDKIDILPNKFKGIGKGKMNERTIEDELLNLQRELKYDDKVRAKEAIARWGRFINPMRLSPEGKNNFQMWIESSDGRKYGDIIKEFELMKIN